MSSTGRGVERIDKEHYGTPIQFIREFLPEFAKVVGTGAIVHSLAFDPCAGGGSSYSPTMPYPEALMSWSAVCDTLDIRPESPALHHGDYLTFDTAAALGHTPTLIISNPPFSLARKFIEKALQDVADGGWVVMLLRMSFMGTQERGAWLKSNMPKYGFVHAKRISFLGCLNKQGKPGTDSCEYAHFCWRKGERPDYTEFRMIVDKENAA